MSDSDLSTPANIPDDPVIEQCLRRISRDALKAEEGDFSVNVARSRAEAELGLDAGFFKNDNAWKKQSKDIVSAAFDDPPSPEKPKKIPPKPKAKPAAKAGTKRKSDEAQPTEKRQKKVVIPDSDVNFEEDGMEDEEPKSKARNSSIREDDGALSEPLEEETSKPIRKYTEDDESDMSSVIDEPAPKKKRQKKSTSPSEAKGKAKKAAKPAKAPKELTPDEEEIKRLQGWLVKCGIRKVWGAYLAKYDTPKQKIKHLKSLLEDVGMTGRYSNEKASQIKEARELADEIEAAKEFNDQWGQKGSDEGSDEEAPKKENAKPRRLKPKGLIDFGDSGDEDSA